MKIGKHYQLATIQHTMRCLRGCLDTVWDVLIAGYSENFPGKKEWAAEMDALRDKIKEIEQRAAEAAARSSMSR